MKIRLECLRPAYADWEQPTSDEVRELLRLIARRRNIERFTGSEAARFLGLEEKSGSRTIRRWTGGHTNIPYAAWGVLCEAAGFGVIWDESQQKAVLRAAEKIQADDHGI